MTLKGPPNEVEGCLDWPVGGLLRMLSGWRQKGQVMLKGLREDGDVFVCVFVCVCLTCTISHSL